MKILRQSLHFRILWCPSGYAFDQQVAKYSDFVSVFAGQRLQNYFKLPFKPDVSMNLEDNSTDGWKCLLRSWPLGFKIDGHFEKLYHSNLNRVNAIENTDDRLVAGVYDSVWRIMVS